MRLSGCLCDYQVTYAIIRLRMRLFRLLMRLLVAMGVDRNNGLPHEFFLIVVRGVDERFE